MLKILYVHGYLGSANGSSSRLLKQVLAENNIDAIVDAPSIPVSNPNEAITMLQNICSDYDVIVASSLGAFYTMQISGEFKILINPADPEDVANLSTPPTVDVIDELRFQKNRFIDDWFDLEVKSELFMIFGTADDIATRNKWLRSFCYPDMLFEVDCGHKANYECMKKVVDIIKNIRGVN